MVFPLLLMHFVPCKCVLCNMVKMSSLNHVFIMCRKICPQIYRRLLLCCSSFLQFHGRSVICCSRFLIYIVGRFCVAPHFFSYLVSDLSFDILQLFYLVGQFCIANHFSSYLVSHFCVQIHFVSTVGNTVSLYISLTL